MHKKLRLTHQAGLEKTIRLQLVQRRVKEDTILPELLAFRVPSHPAKFLGLFVPS